MLRQIQQAIQEGLDEQKKIYEKMSAMREDFRAIIEDVVQQSMAQQHTGINASVMQALMADAVANITGQPTSRSQGQPSGGDGDGCDSDSDSDSGSGSGSGSVGQIQDLHLGRWYTLSA